MSFFSKFSYKQSKIRFFLLLLSIVAFGVAIYFLVIHFFLSKEESTQVGDATISAVTQEIGQEISITGKAELANEQKLRFSQGGKVQEILVKIGDTVEKGDVLAALDKREYFQELKHMQERIADTQKNINEEKNKAHGIESRKMERDIASLERKIKENEEELSRLVQNSPGKAEEKKIDINAKKREIEAQKEKLKLDKAAYEKELKNKDTLIQAKIDESKKSVVSTVQNAVAGITEMKDAIRTLNHIMGFTLDELTPDERGFVNYVSENDLSLKRDAERTYYETIREIDDYERTAHLVGRWSEKVSDARDIVNARVSALKKIVELIDDSRKALNATPTGTNSLVSSAELSSAQKRVSDLRTSLQNEVNSLSEQLTQWLLSDDPEKVKQKFLQELSEKKRLLGVLEDTIAKAEITLKQEERLITITPDGFVQSDELKKEILDKQSAIADQKDDLQNKKEELQKLLSGKSGTLDSLYKTLRDQKNDLSKQVTKEESYEIRAPFSGVIRTIKIKVGDVAGSDSNGEKWILLENSDVINVKVALNQLDIIKVKLWQEAALFFEAIPDANIVGKISEISSTPTENANNPAGGTSYEVVISAPRGKYPIYSGMNARVTIKVGESKKWIVIPSTAIYQNESGDKMVKVKNKNGTVEEVKVEVGEVIDGMTEIVSGVKDGQEVQVINFDANKYKHDDFTSEY